MTEHVELLGTSRTIERLQEQIEQAARSDAKVLLTGESGVGKEVVARLIHRRSARRSVPLVAINCAGLPDSLLESELFGHSRGSFTGAFRDRTGLLEMAHHGTAFLDEIAETSLRMQALLLRFLETGEIQRVGAVQLGTRVDVRIIAATNRNLPERVIAGTFREDLYYRLNVIHIVIAPLRDRREDVPALVRHFARLYAERHRIAEPEISAAAMTRLCEYGWPGNVREIRNVVERMIVFARGPQISQVDLPVEAVAHLTTAGADAESRRRSEADRRYERIVHGGEAFWAAVHAPFMARDLTREDLRELVGRGLRQVQGNYKALVRLFNMDARDYKRFLNFLHKHDCHVPFQPFRAPSPAGVDETRPEESAPPA